MKFAKENETIIRSMYNDGKSTYEIAESLGTYSNKILRAMNYLKIDRRGYSAAQSSALSEGRAHHPTKGRKTSNKTKLRLSEKLVEAYANLSEEEKIQRAQVSKDQWEKMSDAEKDDLRNLAIAATREAAQYGSKTERYVRDSLRKVGHTVKTQVQDLVRNSQLKIDLFVPGLKTVIEIDGPGHFLPIWGEDRLKSQIESDSRKLGLLLHEGYAIIRVKQSTKTLSIRKLEDLFQVLLEKLESINETFPEEGNRLIEVEV